MNGAITGAIAAVLGQKNAYEQQIKKEYRDDVARQLVIAMYGIIENNLKEVNGDIIAVCNVEKNCPNDIKEYLKLELKRKVANDIIKNARLKIDSELHNYFITTK